MRAGTRIALGALFLALGGCETSEETTLGRPATTSPAPAGEARQDPEARAIQCMEAKDWECAAASLRAAGEAGSPPATATRARLATALAAEAKSREKVLKDARPGRDRLVAAQDAAAAWALWSEVTGKPPPASARRISRIVSREEAAAARRSGRDDQPPPPSPVLAPARECCKHCTIGCACGDACISCSKPCHKGPGCAC